MQPIGDGFMSCATGQTKGTIWCAWRAADILGLSPITLRQMRCKGRGPKGCRPEGGRIMGYWLSDVLAYGREGSSGKV